jgi:hypothetical protein
MIKKSYLLINLLIDCLLLVFVCISAVFIGDKRALLAVIFPTRRSSDRSEERRVFLITRNLLLSSVCTEKRRKTDVKEEEIFTNNDSIQESEERHPSSGDITWEERTE